ncbi:MAG: hypothetical protein A3C03_01065 [Candidatus Colwellbacteria bacterium RIFCSPHIGHO2_02_FULL_45_17]|uniref:Excinuclease ABC subunit C n=1 Tax=Candidatus Colwellbacteria bacterium RIFCSPLOWO2_02_FULL_45_11 TaxID=1797692 RepID=A0A1G1ZCP5_9BACT|nr:MAG: hypothetical protein A3C03_01065 [Candidatus Colwellbacteria bacterium RIFCSPHIGHO2_02_FULL_45_17]OGY61650.1 MAG: hypothetical protein A3I33_00990 [Candidatus Colwellbacteria bacterium RIFCSPLOWO2_02_FULL_45_11]
MNIKNLPDSPGVYLFKGARGKILYIGKAGNLKRRVSSYFQKSGDNKIEKLILEAKRIDYIKTDTTIEALILEAELIKRYEPPFNAKEKDDKSFLYVDITKNKFPQVMLSRGRSLPTTNLSKRYGPFTSASQIREALRIIRRIFPYSVHEEEKVGVMKKPCFDHQLGLCPGTCVGLADRGEYIKDIANIKLLFEGKKTRILSSLEKDMKLASKELNFERAEKLKRQIFALKHIHDVALIGDDRKSFADTSHGVKRIEGYDISNISGDSAVGSMVVSSGGVPDKDEYRKFRIKTVRGSNDVAMLTEVLYRRFNNKWRLPDLILVDGGSGQVNAILKVLRGRSLRIPVVGLAKGPTRKKNDVIGEVPSWTSLRELITVRDEAHRFAISYHKKLRSDNFVKK